jgi:hypothetical protein
LSTKSQNPGQKLDEKSCIMSSAAPRVRRSKLPKFFSLNLQEKISIIVLKVRTTQRSIDPQHQLFPRPLNSSSPFASIMAPLFVLSETSAGYALFKATDKKLLKRTDLGEQAATAEGACSL